MDNIPKIDIGRIAQILDKQLDAFSFEKDVELIRLEGYKLNKGELPDISLPLRMDALSIIITLSGHASMEIDSKDYSLRPNTIINLIGFKVLRNGIFSDDYKGYHMIVSNRFYNEIFKEGKHLTPEAAMKKVAFPLDEISPEETRLLEPIIEEIIRTIERRDHVWYRRMVINGVQKFFMETGNIVINRLYLTGKEQNPSDHDVLFYRFMQLLHDNSSERKSVKFYADKLCLTPDYLAQAIKAFSGHNISYWINEALLQQAKMYLLEPGITIQQIADILNFSDQSAFGRFFKKNTGKSPAEYRKFLKSG